MSAEVLEGFIEESVQTLFQLNAEAAIQALQSRRDVLRRHGIFISSSEEGGFGPNCSDLRVGVVEAVQSSGYVQAAMEWTQQPSGGRGSRRPQGGAANAAPPKSETLSSWVGFRILDSDGNGFWGQIQYHITGTER